MRSTALANRLSHSHKRLSSSVNVTFLSPTVLGICSSFSIQIEISSSTKLQLLLFLNTWRCFCCVYLKILKSWSISESPWNRGFLVASSAKIVPVLQTSTGVEYRGDPSRTSGARYQRVTTWEHTSRTYLAVCDVSDSHVALFDVILTCLDLHSRSHSDSLLITINISNISKLVHKSCNSCMKRLQPVSEPLQQFICASLLKLSSHNQTLPGSFMQHVYNSLCCNLLNNVKHHENNKMHNNDAVKYKREKIKWQI